MNRLFPFWKALALFALSCLMAVPAWATPAFARKQQLACPVCHSTFPELNETGRAFKTNGYRFPDGKPGEGVQVTGMDLGSGFVLDPFPGIAVRVESQPITLAPDAKGNMGLSSTPLDSAELIMGGSNGKHWSYWAEIQSAADSGYIPAGNGIIEYRAMKELEAYVGWTPPFSRDPYNAISESRRIDHVDHAAQDYTGSTGVSISDEAGEFGAFGEVGPLYYNVAITPGPGVLPGTTDPLDYFGRVEYNITKKVGVGGYVFAVNTNGGNTVRPALDFNALTDFGTFKAMGQYDTADSAVAVEGGWDESIQEKGFWVIPQARVDATIVGGSTLVTPLVGVGLQASAGRVSIEISDPLGGGNTMPSTTLFVDGLF